MMKKVLALALVMVMAATALTACGQKEAPAGEKTGSMGGDMTATDISSEAEGSREADGNEDEVVELHMYYPAYYGIPRDLQKVEDAVNALVEPQIGVRIKLHTPEVGNYEQQMNLALSSGEQVDLMLTYAYGAVGFTNLKALNLLSDITDEVNTYGQDIKRLLGDILNATTDQGVIYGMCGNRPIKASLYIIMRTDVLEDLGLLEKAENMTTFTEYEEILAAVKSSEKWRYLAGIVPMDTQGTVISLTGNYVIGDRFEDTSVYDGLGYSSILLAADPVTGDGKVYNNFASAQFHEMFERVSDWNKKGYIYKDATAQTEMAESMIKQNTAFSAFIQTEGGLKACTATKTMSCGMPMTCVKVKDMPLLTSNATKFDWVVPVNTIDAQAAVKFLNLMYTSAELNNLLAWGIEGMHYELRDGVACFMEGEDTSSAGYHSMEYFFGNTYLVTPWEGNAPDLRDAQKADMDSGVASAYLGFVANLSGIESEVTAVQNVTLECLPAIASGFATEDDYQTFLDKLSAAGAGKIVDSYQRQLDEWMAHRK